MTNPNPDDAKLCAPPEEWRNRCGWHWLHNDLTGGFLLVWYDLPHAAEDTYCWCFDYAWYDPISAAAEGYRYIAPVLTPDEIAERERAAYRRGQEDMRGVAGNAVLNCYYQECCGEPMRDGECCGMPRIVFSPEAAQSLGATIAALPIKEEPE